MQFCMKAPLDDIPSDGADDISNLWQISIHNISSFIRNGGARESRLPSPAPSRFMNCKKTRISEWRMLQTVLSLEMHADWLSNRGLQKQKQKKM